MNAPKKASRTTKSAGNSSQLKARPVPQIDTRSETLPINDPAGPFHKYIADFDPLLPLLPAIHTTTAKNFRDIVDSGEFLPETSESMLEHLRGFYMFYGRPSYRQGIADAEAGTNAAEYPVSFLLHPDVMKHATVVTPFDTGAFYNKRFSDFITPSFKLKDFQFKGHQKLPARLVAALNASNGAYFNAQPKQTETDPIEYERQTLMAMMRHEGRGKFDDRSSAIELRFDSPIPLQKGLILAVVVPNAMMSSNWFRRNVLDDLGATPLTYNSSTCRSIECHGLLRTAIREYYSQASWINNDD